MVLLALLAAIAQPTSALPPPQVPRGAIVQATATVRIIAGERISADNMPDTAIVTDTRVRGEDGVERPARLVEFP